MAFIFDIRRGTALHLIYKALFWRCPTTVLSSSHACLPERPAGLTEDSSIGKSSTRSLWNRLGALMRECPGCREPPDENRRRARQRGDQLRLPARLAGRSISRPQNQYSSSRNSAFGAPVYGCMRI
jgi:hypothetical protein